MLEHQVKIEWLGRAVSLILPEACNDITLHWKQAFEMADALGSTAFRMPDHPSDPGQDEAEADVLRVGRYQDQFVVLFFQGKTKSLTWNRNAALVVAEKICKMVEKIAEDLNRKRRQ